MTKRKGAASREAITPELLERLNQGIEETATLSEALAIDFARLLVHVAPELPALDIQRMAAASSLGVTKRMTLAATFLATHYGSDAAAQLRAHPADTARGWGAYVIGNDPSLSLNGKIEAIKPLADDPHFCVREWAWLALRESISAEIETAITLLQTWVTSKSEYIRRFAIEATRPRGVWSKHIPVLKQNPGLGESLLNAVMTDPARYVQDSCANWLNDAAKTNPDWVIEFCEQWAGDSDSKATKYIIKRGQRSIN